MTATIVPLQFQVGARTVAVVRRRLARVVWSLDDVREGRALALPPLDGDGYLLTSVPATLATEAAPHGLLAVERQRYTRFYADLSGDYDGWLAALAGDRRAGLRRKSRKLAAHDGGTLDVRAYRTAAELAIFHPLARAVSRRTFQERLLAAGWPTDPTTVDTLHRLAAADRLRAWLLFVAGRPVAYLCCTADRLTLRYDYLGHDPAFSALSPGTVLQHAAMRDLFADRFAWLDFTEGEGQHKRLFATAGVACVDLLLLRHTWRNRFTAAALTCFDAAVARGKRRLRSPALGRLAKRLRR